MPSIVPTTLLVAGSITWTLSPAELVWMTRAVFAAVNSAASRNAG